MKILVISQYYYPEPFKVSDICEELVKKGHSVTVITGIPNYPSGRIYNNYSNKYFRETINGVDIIRCKLRPRKKGKINLFLNYVSFWRSSKRAAKRVKDAYDIVYVWEVSPIFYLSAAHLYAKKNGVKVICYCMDLWPESIKTIGLKENNIIFKVIKRISKKLYNFCDEIIVSSQSFIDYFKNVISYKGKLVYLPQHYAPKFDLSSKHEVDGCFTFIYAGNIGSVQKIENICKAFERINADLWVYGSGSHFEECKNIIQSRSISNVKLFGLVPQVELKEAYSKADFFVLPLSESSFIGKTIPAKMQEYLYYQKPILGAIGGDAKTLLSKLGNSSFCSLDIEDSIVEAANDLMNNYEKYSLAANGAKTFFENNFTIERHISFLTSEFNKMIEVKLDSNS